VTLPPPRPPEPERAIPREIVVLNLTAGEIANLVARGFTVVAQAGQPVLGQTLVRMRVPDDLSTRAGLDLVRSTAPASIADFNHIYGVYRLGAGRCDTPACKQRSSIGWPPNPGACQVVATVGMIDTAVDPANPAVVGQAIEVIDGVTKGRPAASTLHGTAIAALMGGRPDAAVPGLLPKSRVVAISAFHRAPDGEDVGDTFDVVRGIDTLVGRGIRILNLSFTGPDNRVLAQAVVYSKSRGAVLVAASGNAGPGSPPLYPAAYDDVVAVTGVAADYRVYGRANRGRYVDFAGPGVDVQVVSLRAEPRFESGTSFAAPFVSAALAAASAREPTAPIDTIVKRLQASALDLGPPGRDPVFGWGLLQAGSVCP